LSAVRHQNFVFDYFVCMLEIFDFISQILGVCLYILLALFDFILRVARLFSIHLHFLHRLQKLH
jgi:hypothetical protein